MEPANLSGLIAVRLMNNEQDIPQFLGSFDGVAGLPNEIQHLIYYWNDRSVGPYALRLSFNTSQLAMIGSEEMMKKGQIPNGETIGQAVLIFQKLSSDSFFSAMDAMRKIHKPGQLH
jgi:hypothetical protein